MRMRDEVPGRASPLRVERLRLTRDRDAQRLLDEIVTKLAKTCLHGVEFVTEQVVGE